MCTIKKSLGLGFKSEQLEIIMGILLMLVIYNNKEVSTNCLNELKLLDMKRLTVPHVICNYFRYDSYIFHVDIS